MKNLFGLKWVVIVVLGLLPAWPLAGAEDQPGAPGGATPAPTEPRALSSTNSRALRAGQDGTAEAKGTVTNTNAAVVDDILKMVHAGVSKEVIGAYIERVRIESPPTAAQIIALKENGLPDELTIVLVKRGLGLVEPASQSGTDSGLSNPKPPFRSFTDASQADSEGYDFWWYHYAYPRALASANETLFSSYAPFYRGSPQFYGFYPGLAFHPQPLPRFRLR